MRDQSRRRGRKSERSIERQRERELFLLLSSKLICGPIYHHFFITEREREIEREGERVRDQSRG